VEDSVNPVTLVFAFYLFTWRIAEAKQLIGINEPKPKGRTCQISFPENKIDNAKLNTISTLACELFLKGDDFFIGISKHFFQLWEICVQMGSSSGKLSKQV